MENSNENTLLSVEIDSTSKPSTSKPFTRIPKALTRIQMKQKLKNEVA